ncbi:hypothetical protein [Streptomyces sp. NPDC054958]
MSAVGSAGSAAAAAAAASSGSTSDSQPLVRPVGQRGHGLSVGQGAARQGEVAPRGRVVHQPCALVGVGGAVLGECGPDAAVRVDENGLDHLLRQHRPPRNRSTQPLVFVPEEPQQQVRRCGLVPHEPVQQLRPSIARAAPTPPPAIPILQRSKEAHTRTDHHIAVHDIL